MPAPVSVIERPGLFGKTPETGDFIVRRLPSALLRFLDIWVTGHLAEKRSDWPDKGLRGLLEIEEEPILILAVPSQDAVGRRFPLLAVTNGQGLSLEEANSWCEAAFVSLHAATTGERSLSEVLDLLDQIEPQDRQGPSGSAALWVAGVDPMPCDAEAIEALFSSD